MSKDGLSIHPMGSLLQTHLARDGITRETEEGIWSFPKVGLQRGGSVEEHDRDIRTTLTKIGSQHLPLAPPHE